MSAANIPWVPKALQGDENVIIELRQGQTAGPTENPLMVELKAAVRRPNDPTAYLPKELAYENMEAWGKIAAGSNQTSHETSIIKQHAERIIQAFPTNVTIHIIDLGAADSHKFFPYVKAAKKFGIKVVYVPLDMDIESLGKQMNRAKNLCADIGLKLDTVGLHGTFTDGDAFFKHIPSVKLFLSLGSIFYNAPTWICEQRCALFKEHLTAGYDPHPLLVQEKNSQHTINQLKAVSGFNKKLNRLIVGQDTPMGDALETAFEGYQTPYYRPFMWDYLATAQKHLGIKTEVTANWTFLSNGSSSCSQADKDLMTIRGDNRTHFFIVAALQDITTEDGYVIAKDSKYVLFPSWKPDIEYVTKVSKEQGLDAQLIGGWGTMVQYIVKDNTA